MSRSGAGRDARFNPRAREGRDSLLLQTTPRQMGFNPRAREGRDLDASIDLVSAWLFQSTRPRGARLRQRAKINDH